MSRYNPKTVRLTEHDLEVIEQVGKLGILGLENVKKIFHNKSQYYLNRVKVLCNKKYVIRKSNHLTLGPEGRKLLEVQNKEIRVLPTDKTKKARLSSIAKLIYYIDQSVWNFTPSWDVKSGSHEDGVEFNRGSRFFGMLKSKSYPQNKYLMYNIGKEPSASMLSRIQVELRNLHQKRIDKVIILAGSQQAIEAFPVNNNFLSEQLLIPYTNQGIDILNLIGKMDVIEITSRHIYGNSLKAVNWRVADYEILTGDSNKRYLLNLITNDYQKIHYLNDFLQVSAYEAGDFSGIELICMDWQYPKFSKDYKQCKLNVITHTELLNLINKEG